MPARANITPNAAVRAEDDMRSSTAPPTAEPIAGQGRAPYSHSFHSSFISVHFRFTSGGVESAFGKTDFSPCFQKNVVCGVVVNWTVCCAPDRRQVAQEEAHHELSHQCWHGGQEARDGDTRGRRRDEEDEHREHGTARLEGRTHRQPPREGARRFQIYIGLEMGMR